MPKKRSRAISLSVDWDNIVKYKSEGKKVLKAGQFLMTGAVEFERPTEYFCTGSSYTGKWNSLGMSGFGTYIFPHGAEYEGYMEDGMFHGEGTISYPMGQKMDAVWVKGKMVSFKFRYPDGLEYVEPWEYCRMPDRRFYSCIKEGLQPAGREFLTNFQPTRPIDEGCYDTGDGFYNPTTKCVTSATDPTKIIRKVDEDDSLVIENDYWSKFICVPTKKEEKWIIENCRKAWDEPAGYRPDLFERWITGRREELGHLDYDLVKKSSSDSTFGASPAEKAGFLMYPKMSEDTESVSQFELYQQSLEKKSL